MSESTIGKIRVYQENDLQTMKRIMFEVNFDPNEPETITHQMSKNENMGLFLELDIFRPTERELEYLRDENERYSKRIDDLEEIVEDLEESVEDMKDFAQRATEDL